MSSSTTPSPENSKSEKPVSNPACHTTSSSNPLTQMATLVQSQQEPTFPSATMSAHDRPRLPPILSLDELHRGFPNPPLMSPPAASSLYTNPFHNTSPASKAAYETPEQVGDRYRRNESFRPVRSPFETSQQVWGSNTPVQGLDPHSVPSKRSHQTMSEWPERHAQSSHYGIGSSVQSEAGRYPHSSIHPSLPPSSRSSLSEQMTSTRTHSLATTNITDYSSTMQYQRSNNHRCLLHIRQQPRAARAGPDGKDRRAIDPPPVLQLLLTDFDANSEEDMNELRSSYFVVHCRLVSAQSPKKDMSTLSSTSDDGSTEVQRLLLGTSVASPFFCADDPDIDNMPMHPKCKPKSATDPAPPSPTSRFILPRTSTTAKTPTKESDVSVSMPGTFFIFADLSIRRAGEYRLEFCLMKVEPSTMVAGSKLPILHSVTSHVFKVVNAKDFDQVQPSTELVKGLLDRGAGFPLKLKKGTREGGRRRNATDSEGGGGSIGGGEDDDDDDDDDEE